jgi:hypothetical protein
LQNYEKNLSYKAGFAYIKYGEDEQERIEDRLKKIDAPLYRMLNPDVDRIKMKNVPINLNSTYDYYDLANKDKEFLKEGVSKKTYKVN